MWLRRTPCRTYFRQLTTACVSTTSRLYRAGRWLCQAPPDESNCDEGCPVQRTYLRGCASHTCQTSSGNPLPPARSSQPQPKKRWHAATQPPASLAKHLARPSGNFLALLQALRACKFIKGGQRSLHDLLASRILSNLVEQAQGSKRVFSLCPA